MSESIDDAAARLTEVLQEHAAIMRDNPDDPPKAVGIGLELQAAAKAYADAVGEHAGWGNPFHDLYDLDGEDETAPTADASASPAKLSLAIRSDFIVADEAAVLEMVQRLGLPVGAGARGVLAELYLARADSAHWAAPAFNSAGEVWQVVAVDRTLDQMTPAEKQTAL